MAARPGIRSIAVNGLTTAGLTGIEIAVRAAYFIAITRLVGPEGFGLWTYALALYGLVFSAVSLGFETTVPNAYGNDTAKGDRFAGGVIGLRMACCLAAGAMLALYALVLVPQADERLAILVVAPALLFRGTALVVRATFAGRQDTKRTIVPVLSGRLVELVAGLAIILSGGGIFWLLALHGLCWALEMAIGLRALRQTSALKISLPDPKGLVHMVRTGAPITLLDLTNGFLLTAAIILYQPYAASFAEVGQIGVAVQLAGFLLAAGFSFLGSAAPVLARTLENRDSRAARYGWLVALAAIAGTGAILLGFELLSGPLFEFFLGHRYDLARDLTFTTLLSAGLVLLPHGFQQLLILERRLGGLLLANLSASLLAAALMLSAGPTLNPQGAVEAVLAGWGLRAAIMVLLGAIHGRQLARRFRPG